MSGLATEVRAARRLSAPKLGKLIREAAGVSQQRVADELGVNRVTIARWELGLRRPRGNVLLAYLKLLDELKAAAGSS